MLTGQGTDYCHNAIAGCFSKPANPVQWRIRYIRFSLKADLYLMEHDRFVPVSAKEECNEQP